MTQCTKQFDPLKPYSQRDGKTELRILEANRRHEFPIVVLYTSYPEGKEEVCFYPQCGHFSSQHLDSRFDLINEENSK